MTRKFSAYLSIYNDWDILPAALRSIASYVDEMVVVDGAYEWMVPYLTTLGLDPERSDPRVYAALEASGIPLRIISRTWQNEVEKRRSGYEACTHDYIYRVDADEVLFFDDAALEASLSSGLAVGEMTMPNYVAPGWISRAKDLPRIERQCFLFDRRQVNSEIHLNYLWLILTVDALPQAGSKPFPVYPVPLAFNAHLTGWRTPETGVSRAAFYELNWMRQGGVPWVPALCQQPLTDIRALFDIVPPSVFLSALRKGRIAMGMIERADHRSIVPTTLSAQQDATLGGLYDRFLGSLAAMNLASVAEEQPFLTSIPTLLDLSTSAARDAIAPNGTVTMRISAPVLSAKVRLWRYATSEPSIEERDLPTKLDGHYLRVELPRYARNEGRLLRECLEFQVWLSSQNISQRYRVVS
jgi:hypothetical protein